MVLKCPSLIQIKREKKHSTDQIKRIRGLAFSATEERRLSALWPMNMLHDIGKVCLLLCEPKELG